VKKRLASALDSDAAYVDRGRDESRGDGRCDICGQEKEDLQMCLEAHACPACVSEHGLTLRNEVVR
jgi:hypothetical protein